jgi:ABC-type cobalamin/Fe3+-siderophores transport system ATPase subunit
MSKPVVIAGGGFGGLYTALALASKRHHPPILLIEPGERFLFLPLLYELLSGELRSWEICPRYDDLLAGRGVAWLRDRVAAVDANSHQVHMASGRSLQFSQLVLATGGGTETFGVPGAREHGLFFRTLADVERLNQLVETLRQRRGAQQRIAIVGPSGAGKSTLGRLLAGVHPPRTGEVTVGGTSLAHLSTESVRSRIALVTQEHHVFTGTLRDNLAIANSTATDDEYFAALDAVDADWARSMPLGLDEPVGSGGAKLSPAQAQQIALARIVLADPHTLVLDEATSLLDPRSARHLERSLAAVLTGRTVIAIAHRLHTAHRTSRQLLIPQVGSRSKHLLALP